MKERESMLVSRTENEFGLNRNDLRLGFFVGVAMMNELSTL